VELEMRNQITPELSTLASYTWNRLRFQDTKDNDNTPQLTPDQMASFWARYQFPAASVPGLAYAISGNSGRMMPIPSACRRSPYWMRWCAPISASGRRR
jgi:outer membrane receptor protein involved in Fe transport